MSVHIAPTMQRCLYADAWLTILLTKHPSGLHRLRTLVDKNLSIDEVCSGGWLPSV